MYLLTNWLEGIDLDAIVETLQEMMDWIIDGLTGFLEAIVTWFDYSNAAVGRLTSYVSGFGSVIQSTFNAIPNVYKDVVILAITLTIIFVYYKRTA